MGYTEMKPEEFFDSYEPLANRLLERNALDVDFIDVRGTLGVTDLFVIATAMSEIHLNSIRDDAQDYLESTGLTVRVEGESSSRWKLLDAGDVVVHLFSRQAREFYDLERIWGDSPTRHYQDPNSVE